MLGRMNTSVDPCSDFFSYSCGAWISSRKVLLDMNVFDADRNSVMSDVKLNLMQRLIEMLEQEVTSTDSDYMAAAKLHFQSCLDSNNRPDSSLVTKDVESLLESLGVGSSMTSFMTPSVMQYSLFSDYGAFGFFTYDVNSRVVGNIKRTILQLSPPDLYLRQSVYLLPYEDNEIGRRYLDRVVPLIQRFNSFLRPTFSNGQIDGLLRAKVQEVFEFERQLSQAIRVAKSSNEENALYPVSALIQNFPNINWTEALPSQQFSTNTPVQLNHPSYFTSLNGMLGRTEKSTLIMYLYIRVILTGIIPFAPKSTRQFMDNLYDTETAQEYTKTYCIDSTLELLPEEVLIEYSGKQNQNVKPVLEYISSLVKNLTDQSIKSFSSYGGYSDKTKLKITETLSSLTLSNAPIPVIPWTVLLSTNKDVFHLFRANYAQQAHSFRLMNRIGEVYSVPNIPWYTIDIVYDEDINTLGISYGILTWKTNLRPEFPFLTTVGLLISEKVTDVIYGKGNIPFCF
ncbi:endothelin-converting enzyme 1-like [Saccostrea echinata]|uniref:endothelin-converting enzyme 1-like n=1 Tax=Saccostrea echinata TaxID=191078 RepID=UPI002A804744|nr:endothelin-converting enzyme 1-like [Saccostrea echinata]